MPTDPFKKVILLHLFIWIRGIEIVSTALLVGAVRQCICGENEG